MFSWTRASPSCNMSEQKCRYKMRHNTILTWRTLHHHERVVMRNIIWKFNEEILRNGKVIANVKFSCPNPSTKRSITPSNVVLTLRTLHYHKRVVINNIFWKFHKEILINGKVIANIKFSWRTGGPTDGQSDPYVSPFFWKIDTNIPQTKRIMYLNMCLNWRIMSGRNINREHVLGGKEAAFNNLNWTNTILQADLEKKGKSFSLLHLIIR
jgi:hypothetical protein